MTQKLATPNSETQDERRRRFLLQGTPKEEMRKDFASVSKRFKYLLNLSDLFRHFIDLGASKDKQLLKLVRTIDTKKHNKSSSRSAVGNGRHRRKSEKEEDAELIYDEEFEEETTCITESPSFIHGTLRDYQIQGLNWLISLHENCLSGILADEMGLGKTLQTIAFLGHLRYNKGIDGPHIVIVPKSTLDNWRREFAKWTPDVNTLVLQGTKEERALLLKDKLMEADFDVCITSFEMVIREKAKLGKIRWQYIVIDEAHRIKNEESALSQIIRLFYSRNRLLITGTPLQNNLHELWALLNFILPDVFGESDVFDEWFESQSQDQDEVVQKLHKVLSPFLLRRVKSDVEKSLLPKKEVNLYVGMTEMQIKLYRNLLEKDIDAVNCGFGKREGKTRLLNIVMQLRKCCNHPYLFEGVEPGPPFTTDEHLVYNSAKMIVLDKLLKKMKEQGSRVLIFSQMSRLLDILEDYCFFREYEYCRIDGSTAHEDRINAIDEYNKPDSKKFIFLLTTRAGGLGINLTSADIVVLYDSDWNPQADLQAMDRAHRIGQKKQVQVFRFVTENAIEEKVLERAAQKLRLDQLVIQQGRASSNKNQTIGNSKDELLDMIQHGAQQMFETKGSTVGDDDIDSILRKGEEKTASLNAKFSNLGLDDLQNFTSEASSAYEWNGKNFAQKNNRVGRSYISLAKRERKELQYDIDKYYDDMLLPGGKQSRGPRPPKHIIIHDFQFFPPGLAELLEREQLAFKRKIGHQVTLKELGGSDDEDLVMSEGEEHAREIRKVKEQNKIDNAVELTEEEQALKDKYLGEGFSKWSRRDFTNFIHACANHGRENLTMIAKQMKNKTFEEVEAYSKAFWANYKQVQGYEKYIQEIELGEQKAHKLRLQHELLAEKIRQCKSPLRELVIQYPPNNSKKVYTDLEDRYLLTMLNKHGLNRDNLYDIIKREICQCELFKFDWYFRSRTPQELARRCNTLLLAIIREIDGPLATKRKRNNLSKETSLEPSVEPESVTNKKQKSL
ncbi:ATP-dependent DNA translocase [Komagataella phaffii CBS 7435]|uniref:ATP-dependent DNA translocase n=1 Tax=Komagataella phaffii (strain ATCC 76273 / CBS 7435 / CECT 11047 / NRRL Y-11430 / Wegner 21-1) TaxID=981350 RepID=F2R061_KOMPC|nr:GQ67_04437T0 [Komagataella phaffii]AOA69919.1 GQ68_04409T0 [Komagataella phaffii GS115]CAH2451300.1 ATP-dependent DNA translocase [Komagataella phaffii CBS 7435]CCA41039.1 ATP-dependent DNA translocase [Komagataella phaffii CBS 7435]